MSTILWIAVIIACVICSPFLFVLGILFIFYGWALLMLILAGIVEMVTSFFNLFRGKNGN